MKCLNHDEEILETLKVMLRQEEDIYGCQDYLSADYPVKTIVRKPLTPNTSLRVIEECANLVTDISFNDMEDRSKDTMSPNDVRFRSDTSKTSDDVTLPTKDSIGNHLLGDWRSQMCSWAYSVVDTFEFSRMSVAMAFNYLDRFLAIECLRLPVAISREDFQLFSMTALYLAVKVHESGERLPLDTLVDMSRNYFTHEDFERAESDMIQALQWRLSPPIASRFLIEFWNLYPIDELDPWTFRCYDLLEVLVGDSFLLFHKQLHIALATMLFTCELGIQAAGMEEFCNYLRKVICIDMKEVTEVYDYICSH
jgi:Cyclin, N-terminal domain